MREDADIPREELKAIIAHDKPSTSKSSLTPSRRTTTG